MQDRRTVRQHVLTYARRDPVGGAAALRDVTPGPVPIGGAVATAAFEMLSASRGYSMSGPHPIGLAEIDAYSRLVAPLLPRDVKLITAMDLASRSEAESNG